MTSGSIMQSKEASNGLPIPSHLYLLECPYLSAFRARFWFAIGDSGLSGCVFVAGSNIFLYRLFPFMCYSLLFWTSKKTPREIPRRFCFFLLPLFRSLLSDLQLSIRKHGYAFFHLAASSTRKVVRETRCLAAAKMKKTKYQEN